MFSMFCPNSFSSHLFTHRWLSTVSTWLRTLRDVTARACSAHSQDRSEMLWRQYPWEQPTADNKLELVDSHLFIHPSNRTSLRHVPHKPLGGPSGAASQLFRATIYLWKQQALASFPFLSHFPTPLLACPEITSCLPVNYLHSNPCFKVCIWGKPAVHWNSV